MIRVSIRAADGACIQVSTEDALENILGRGRKTPTRRGGLRLALVMYSLAKFTIP